MSKKEPSKALTIFKWVRDLAVVGLLIWYFSTPQHTTSFWSTLGGWFNHGRQLAVGAVPWLADKADTAQMQQRVEAPPASQNARPALLLTPPSPTPEQLAKEVPGDCLPPEARRQADAKFTATLFYQEPLLAAHKKVRHGHGKPVQFVKKTIDGVPFYVVSVDLNDADSYIVVRLPKNSTQANSVTFTAGHELFDSFVQKYPAAVLVNGTFFSKDDQERVMGNMVSEGKFLKYSQWENYGTTLSLSKGDRPEMVTARVEGVPHWDKQWLSITCGPRLLKHGEVWLFPELEGFADPHVLGVGPRSAIGFTKNGDKLLLVTFMRGLNLQSEAQLMKKIGCYEAMNLDGGASKALAHDKHAVIKPGRGLTNVLVVYDADYKAPEQIVTAWQQFQDSAPE